MAFNEQPSQPSGDTPAAATALDQASATTTTASPRELLDTARRAMALKQYDAATDQLATVLELLRDTHGEDHQSLAPILHLYGRALLETAIANSGALGGGGGAKDAPMPSRAKPASTSGAATARGSGSGSAKSKVQDPRFSFSGDAESDDEDDAAEGAEDGAEGGEDEEDDDLGVAFSVLDLARVIYQRALDGDSKQLETLEGAVWDETKVKAELAEVLNDLGDVGLESENFQQASSDYQACLTLLTPLLHPHSRRLADAHLRLGLALEFHPTVSEREGAIRHVKAASGVLATRLAALEERQKTIASLALPSPDAQRVLANAEAARSEKIQEGEGGQEGADQADGKGKGKAPSSAAAGDDDEAARKLEKDDILGMTSDQVTLELKDVREMKEELDTKLDEYESPSGLAKLSGEPEGNAAAAAGFGLGEGMTATSTKAALEQAIADAFLGGAGGSDDAARALSALRSATGSSSSGAASVAVNDLSKMVKRKKKAEPEIEAEAEAQEGKGKKARVDDESEA
ncbi:uncharacterized protein PFL1_05848 [Pseudozyma flocculosa PF-1]|uniref:Tetratricopeptide SHNi-TPR domain-containing protein n=2 Tax=Pseudozyma flocculosa TaxID=84751 RepID=A0A5C3F1T7_9BASI|nr:uncharacterized protein PFL1_05848 [Pseudozyma flocculosa PF-1]EPQ26526.1 hypothetical protein PFL1_05848 [Pseudozyma flocculosa PF-1]SPO38483.1 uncharacterized protein PSFLO_03961 [Pseudozyma flocculosa]